MATSNVTTSTLSRDEIINRALKKVGGFSRFEPPEAEDIEDAAAELNSMILAMNKRSDGIPNPRLWVRKRALLVLEKGKFEYILGGENSDLVVDKDDLLIANGAPSFYQGAPPLCYSDITAFKRGMTLDKKIAGRYRDRGTLHYFGNITNYLPNNDLITAVATRDFSNATGWTLGTGWAISGGLATCDGTQVSASNLYCTPGITDAQEYKVFIHVTAVTSGTLTPVLGDLRGEGITKPGLYIQYVSGQSSPSNTEFKLEASIGFAGSVTAVAMQTLVDGATVHSDNYPVYTELGEASGNVYFYTKTIDKPLDILTMFRRDVDNSNDNDSPMSKLTSQQYDWLPDKNQLGGSMAYYYEEKRDHGILYLDSSNTQTTDLIGFTYISPLQVFTSADDEADFPASAQEMLIYNLAVRIASNTGKTVAPDVAAIAQSSYAVFANDDPETVSIIFEPDRVDEYEGVGRDFL